MLTTISAQLDVDYIRTPFGLAFNDASTTNNRYLYNRKELENYTIGSSYLDEGSI